MATVLLFWNTKYGGRDVMQKRSTGESEVSGDWVDSVGSVSNCIMGLL